MKQLKAQQGIVSLLTRSLMVGDDPLTILHGCQCYTSARHIATQVRTVLGRGNLEALKPHLRLRRHQPYI